MEAELNRREVSKSAIEKIHAYKQTHLLDVLPLIKDPKELNEFIDTIESIDYALLEQVK